MIFVGVLIFTNSRRVQGTWFFHRLRRSKYERGDKESDGVSEQKRAGRVTPGVTQADADFANAIPSSCFALSKQHDYIRLPLFC